MILAGDEIGHSQGGNNNAYAQDNETTWLDWSAADTDFLTFTRQLIAFRKAHPILRQRRFLHGDQRQDGTSDLVWRRADGTPVEGEDWNDPNLAMIAAELRFSGQALAGEDTGEALFLVINRGDQISITLPQGRWVQQFETATPNFEPYEVGAETTVPRRSIAVFSLADT